MKLFQAIPTIDNELSPKSIFTCKHKKIRKEDTEIKDIIDKAKENKVSDFEVENNEGKRLRILIAQSFDEKNGTMKIKLANSERRKISRDEEVEHIKIIDKQNQIHCFVQGIV